MTNPHRPKKRAFDRTRTLAENTLAGGKKHAVSLTISTIITLVSSTFVPMLEQHWQDEGVQAQISDVKADALRASDAEKADRVRDEGTLWHEIHSLERSTGTDGQIKIPLDPAPILPPSFGGLPTNLMFTDK